MCKQRFPCGTRYRNRPKQEKSNIHILYTLSGDEVEQWFKVSDITSLSHQEEKRKHLASQKVTASVSANTILSGPSSCQGNFKRDINETPTPWYILTTLMKYSGLHTTS